MSGPATVAAQAKEPKEPGVAQSLLPAGRAQERGLGPGHYPPSNLIVIDNILSINNR